MQMASQGSVGKSPTLKEQERNPMLFDPRKTVKLSKLHLRAALWAELQNMTDGGRPIADPSWFI